MLITEQKEITTVQAAAKFYGYPDVSKLHRPMHGPQLVKALVAQYLTHNGYAESAKAFAEEVNAANKLLDHRGKRGTHAQPDLQPIDDEEAYHRQSMCISIRPE